MGRLTLASKVFVTCGERPRPTVNLVGYQREAPYKIKPVTERSTCDGGIEQSDRLIRWEGEPMNIALALMVVVIGLFLVNIMGARD